MYLQLISFLHTDLTQVVEILPQARPAYFNPLRPSDAYMRR